MKHTLAIPNYNGSQNIRSIISQAVKEDFDKIYIIDDASTDDSVAIAKEFAATHENLNVLANDKNVGPAANRSRVLDYQIGDVLTFVDVDMKFQTVGWVEKIEQVFQDDSIGLVGWRINTKKNEPMWWNYGYELNAIRSIKAAITHRRAFRHWDDREYIDKLRSKALESTYNLEISFGEQVEREVDWVSEAAFSIRSSVFKELGGFDKNMRYHGDQDLCKRVRGFGYKIVYSPLIQVRHLEIDTFGEERDEVKEENAQYFMKKHGLK